MKKITMFFLFILAFCVCISGVAEESKPETFMSGIFKYALLEDGTAEIVECYSNYIHLKIPESLDGYTVSSISSDAFLQSKAFEELTIPDSVTNIGANPIRFFTSVSRINVSQDHPVFAIIDGVLFSKPDKKLICFPASIKASEYTIPQGIKIIGESAFARNPFLTKVNIPDSVTAICDSAFEWCRSLPEITIPDSVTDIGDNAFSECEVLTKVTLPNSVTAIGSGVFSECKALSEVTIPNGVTTIGERAFESCMALTDVKIPDSVTVIGRSAYCKCDCLKYITIPDSVTTICDNAFEYTGLIRVTLPDSVTEIGGNPFFHCYNLKEITVSPDHPYLETINGVLFSKPDKRLICYPYLFKASEYTIPEGTRIIGKYAFGNSYHLAEITLPDSITEIGDYAFTDCRSVAKLTIPDSVTVMGQEVFEGCEKDLVVTVGRGSCAEQYCAENRIIYDYPDSNDWLND